MISDWEIALRLLIAAGLGSLIGFERERLLWAAGIRTHMLVCVGACLVMIVSAFGFSDIMGTKDVVLDPSRVAAQVVSGIGFLGAGSILLRNSVVRGLTTAASIWTVAGIGLAVGGGLYFAGVASTLIILIILAGVKPLEEFPRRHEGGDNARICYPSRYPTHAGVAYCQSNPIDIYGAPGRARTCNPEIRSRMGGKFSLQINAPISLENRRIIGQC